jgi:lipid A 4'-phosphatase
MAGRSAPPARLSKREARAYGAPRKSREHLYLKVVVYTLAGLAALATVISLIGPNPDLAIAGLSFDTATGRFIEGLPYIGGLRDHGLVAVSTCIACVVLALVRFIPGWRLPSLAPRSATFLTLGLLLGPGLLVNGILKPYWGRPRPLSVTEFGGSQAFVNWWDPTGTCPQNCSFVSGEAATAAWMFGPAMLVPAPWRGIAILAAAVFTAFMSMLRISVGAHFFTDVVFGALSTVLILLAMRALTDRIWDANPGMAAVGAGSGRSGRSGA